MKIKAEICQDGDRTIIALEGASLERNQVLIQILKEYCTLAEPDPIEIEGLEPPPPMEEMLPDPLPKKFIISDGPYQNMTPIAALEKENGKALATLFLFAKSLDKQSLGRKEIISSCKQYMLTLPDRKDQFPTTESKKNFLHDIEPVQPIRPFILNYTDAETFFRLASDTEVDRVFCTVLKTLQDRASL